MLLGVATLVFSLIHLVPGDPAQSMLGEGASAKEVADLRVRLGLDRPLLEQYVRLHARRWSRGDLGTSFRTSQPVVDRDLGTRAGDDRARAGGDGRRAAGRAAAGHHRRGAARHVGRPRGDDVALAGISIPNFWLGPMLAIVFAVALGWLPVSGRGGWDSLVLPAISLGAALAAILARMTRASLLEELRELYVRAARARGVSRSRAILGHALRNSLIPLVTISACSSARC